MTWVTVKLVGEIHCVIFLNKSGSSEILFVPTLTSVCVGVNEENKTIQDHLEGKRIYFVFTSFMHLTPCYLPLVYNSASLPRFSSEMEGQKGV